MDLIKEINEKYQALEAEIDKKLEKVWVYLNVGNVKIMRWSIKMHSALFRCLADNISKQCKIEKLFVIN